MTVARQTSVLENYVRSHKVRLLSYYSFPTPDCAERRIAGADLNRVANWQDNWTSRPQTQRFKVTIAYNGFGATTAGGAATNDSLVSSARNHANKFYWVSHTYDHENLDCYQRWARRRAGEITRPTSGATTAEKRCSSTCWTPPCASSSGSRTCL